MSLPDLSKLLRIGGSIGIHDGQGRLFSSSMESSGHPFVGKTAEEAFASRVGVRLVAVIRDRDVLTPDGAGPIRVGDSLILAGSANAHAEYLKMQGDDAILRTD